MKIVLGLNAFHADTSACLIKDNKIIAAIEEERITRKKHSSDFPINSINECLKIANIPFSEITNISINSDPSKNLYNKFLHFFKNFELKKINNLFLNRLKNKFNLKQILKKNYKLNNDLKINNIEHHLSHLSSSFYASGFEKAVGLSIDGSGDFCSLVIAECNYNKIKIKKRINFPHSLGLFYQGMTQLIGFNNYGDEYKLMGLAPYGRPIFKDKIKSKLFKNTNDLFNLDLKYFNHHKLNFKYDISESVNIDQIISKRYLELIKNEFNDNEKTEEYNQNIASSTQKIFEEYFQKILNYLKQINFSKNIIYAGGCALNSSANKLLLNNTFFDKIFIPFAPADNGGALGSAIYTYCQNGNKINNIQTPYLGSDFNNQEIEKLLKNYVNKYNLKIQKFNNFDELCEKAVDQLTNDSVIGWFQGKMEFGPRSLGNRSILADPRKKNMKDIINKKIKRRENFRPFAPSVLKEYQHEWFEENFDNLYMSSVMSVKTNKINLIPAVVHVDGSSRVQTVKKENNNKFHNLISKFYIKTKIPMLLNTSFNENEPIVRKPEEAINCLLRTDMDSLYINDFCIEKIR